MCSAAQIDPKGIRPHGTYLNTVLGIRSNDNKGTGLGRDYQLAFVTTFLPIAPGSLITSEMKEPQSTIDEEFHAVG